jgi:GDSL-like Lipase/Acylhydrolase family
VLQAIHTKAPNAEVLVVGYPALLPANGSGCWPQMPLTFNDVPYLRAKAIQLNNMLVSTASANGAIYVDTYRKSVSHNACTAGSTRWVEPLLPGSPAAPVHPNAAGEAAMATILLSKM